MSPDAPAAAGTAADIRHAALDLLTRREHSRGELSRKLGRRFDKLHCRLHKLEIRFDKLERNMQLILLAVIASLILNAIAIAIAIAVAFSR